MPDVYVILKVTRHARLVIGRNVAWTSIQQLLCVLPTACRCVGARWFNLLASLAHSQAQHRMTMGLSLVNFANPATELLQVRDRCGVAAVASRCAALQQR
jgi:hypothetical protein